MKKALLIIAEAACLALSFRHFGAIILALIVCGALDREIEKAPANDGGQK